MNFRSITGLALLLLITISLTELSAKNTGRFTVSKMFSNNMVLQRDMKVPVWGWAEPDEKIEVIFNGQELETSAGSKGKWM